MKNRLEYFRNLLRSTLNTQATFQMGGKAAPMPTPAALERLEAMMVKAQRRGNTVIFIGNGGSAAIASHMATDYCKNGGVRSIAFSDAPTLTCVANDYGYDNVFAKQLEWHARRGDVVVIISSSGRSLNILAAAEAARTRKCGVVTFTGMNERNALRRRGHLNFYVPDNDYGMVELAHLGLLHSIVSRLELAR